MVPCYSNKPRARRQSPFSASLLVLADHDLGYGKGWCSTSLEDGPTDESEAHPARATLTTILVSLLLLTMGSFGVSFYRNARFTADNLSTQILDQNSRMVDFQINELLHVANEQGRTNLRLLQSGTFRADRFVDLGRYWANVMEVHPAWRGSRSRSRRPACGSWWIGRAGSSLSTN